MSVELVVGGAALALSAVAVVVVLSAREQVARACRAAEDARAAARQAKGRAAAMAGHRVPLEVILQEWGITPRRSFVLAREIHRRVLDEVRAGGLVDGAAPMATARAREIGEQYRVPRDGGPSVTATRHR